MFVQLFIFYRDAHVAHTETAVYKLFRFLSLSFIVEVNLKHLNL